MVFVTTAASSLGGVFFFYLSGLGIRSLPSFVRCSCVFFSIHVLFAINFFVVTVSLVLFFLLFVCLNHPLTLSRYAYVSLWQERARCARLRYVRLNKLLKVYYVLLLSLVFYCFPLFRCLRSASCRRHRHCRRCRWFFLKFTFANQSWFLIDFNGFPHALFVATTITTNLTMFFPTYFLVVFHCNTINKYNK